MNNKLVIGLSGWKGSGKDMVADFLVKEYNFQRLSFADPLKVMASKEYGIPLDAFYDRDKKEAPILSLPVRITDRFIAVIVDLLKDEFRSNDGKKPDYIDKNGKGLFYVDGLSANGDAAYSEDIYFTPRNEA